MCLSSHELYVRAVHFRVGIFSVLYRAIKSAIVGEFAPGWRVKVKAALALTRHAAPLVGNSRNVPMTFAFPFAIYPLQEIPRSLPAVGLWMSQEISAIN